MKITIRGFSGLRPIMAPDLLSAGEATEAVNTDLSGGDLEPFAGLSAAVITLTSATPVKTIYRFGQNATAENQYWFQTTGEARFVKGPVDNDTEERTYATGHLAYPSKTSSSIALSATPYPSTSYPMGIAKPASALTATVTGSATNADDPAETVTYVVTLVTNWGEEGPPSAPSTPVSWRPGQSISLTSIPTTGVASYPGNSNKSQPYSAKRIYRSATGSSTTARFLFWKEIAVATTSDTDTTLTANLGEAMVSRYWLEPPDAMVGLTQMANGILAGYTGTTVCFSEPFVPYAWPVRYQQSVDAPVVGMASFDQTLVVATKRSIYLFTGSEPGSMTSERLALTQTCVSSRSMVEMLGGVVFACPDGLAFIGPGGFRLLTDTLLSREQWQAYKPDSIHAYETDGKYIAFYDTGAVQKGLVFNLGSKPTFCETDIYALAGFRDRGRDALYLCVAAGGTSYDVKKWDAGTSASMAWTSGEFRVPAHVNMAVARVQYSGSVNFSLYADGVLKYGPAAVTTQFSFKLPADYRAYRFKVRVTGTGTVRAIELADSVRALVSE